MNHPSIKIAAFSVLLAATGVAQATDNVAETGSASASLQLEIATLLGGASEDRAHGIAVDGQDNIFLTAPIQSQDFPITADALNPSPAGIYLATLSPAGAVLYSTFLGASGGANYAHSVALGGDGSIYVAGNTTNPTFPTSSGAFQTVLKGPSDANASHGDAFVIKLSPSGDRVIYATFLGGSGPDIGGKIAVDAEGNAYLLGCTSSPDFPVTPGSLQTAFSGGEDEPTGRGDLFVAKLSPDGSALVYCTYLGGSGTEVYGDTLVLDATGAVTFGGSTTSPDFPTTAQAIGKSYRGGSDLRGGGDGFVVRLNPTGNALEYASYVGGSGDESVRSVAVDTSGNIWLAGDTTSSDFPTTTDAHSRKNRGAADCFFLQLDPRSGALLHASLLGGGKADRSGALVVHASGWLVLAGRTESVDFPVTTRAAGMALQGPADLFIALFDQDAKSLGYCTTLGGSGNEVPGPLLATRDSIYLAGNTTSADFPVTTNATFAGGTNPWGGDAFVVRFALSVKESGRSSPSTVSDALVSSISGAYLGQPRPVAVPKVFARGIVSGGDNEHSAPAFSPDGDELFWFSNRPPGPGHEEWLFFSRTMRREGGQWTAPSNSPFPGMFVFSPDGRRGFFATLADASKSDLWIVDKQGARWGEPRCLDFLSRFPELKAVYMASVADTGTLYLFGQASGPEGALGIYRSELVAGEYAKPQLLPPAINLPGCMNWAPFIAPDESYLLFSSGRTGGLDEFGDIYISRRLPDGGWSDPANLGEPVNTPRQEVFPGLSPDGEYLFFCRDTPDRGNDVYWVKAATIPALRPAMNSAADDSP